MSMRIFHFYGNATGIINRHFINESSMTEEGDYWSADGHDIWKSMNTVPYRNDDFEVCPFSTYFTQFHDKQVTN